MSKLNSFKSKKGKGLLFFFLPLFLLFPFSSSIPVGLLILSNGINKRDLSLLLSLRVWKHFCLSRLTFPLIFTLLANIPYHFRSSSLTRPWFQEMDMIVTLYLKNGSICPSLPYQMAHTTTKKVCKLTVEQSIGAFFFFQICSDILES